jgi:hypothetical protein
VNLSDLAADELTGPLPPRVAKVLDTAAANGWVPNGKGITLCVRLDHPTDEDAVPFYVTWQLAISPEGKRSWRFWNAGAANFQPLNYSDVLTYLADPSVIWPELPTEETA